MEKKINIAELLKDCPQGMELDSTMYDNLYFDSLDADYNGIIICYTLIAGTKTFISFTKYGTFNNHMGAKCVIFPKGKTTWEGFVTHCLFKDGDILAYTGSYTTVFIYRNKDNEPKYATSFYVGYTIGRSYCNFHIYNKSTLIALNGDCDVRHATEEEKQKLFDEIKANGYKWDAETKTLEKLVEPKFKVGDKVRYKNNHNVIFTITSLYEDYYGCGIANAFCFEDQDDYELVPNKFDITTLVPFESRVLVRQNNSGIWGIDFFGFYNEGYYRTTGNCIYLQCVPYEQNEHLLGKTDDCDEYYKTWE